MSVKPVYRINKRTVKSQSYLFYKHVLFIICVTVLLNVWCLTIYKLTRLDQWPIKRERITG